MTRPYITVSPPPSQSSLLSHADDIIVDHFHYTHMKTANFPSRRGSTAYLLYKLTAYVITYKRP